MILVILRAISQFILFVIQKIGYAGIFLLMLVQSANIPIPSEVIMPFSGFLTQKGVFNFWLVVFVGALGNLVGSLVSYKLASLILENGWLEKHRILNFFINLDSLNTARRWFIKYGHSSIFFGRMIPVVSTFISFPAGLAKMRVSTFSALTFLGAFIWSFFLTWLGFVMGQNWPRLQVYFEKFDYFILLFIIIGAVYWFWHRFRMVKNI